MENINNITLKFWGDIFRENENYIYLPNDIFAKLNTRRFKIGKHKLVAVVYYFVISWAYRYARIDDIYRMNREYIPETKNICGINRDEKRIDYVIKKNGVLDRIKLTKEVNILDAPMSYYLDKYTNYLSFEYIRESPFREYPSRLMIKEPLTGTRERKVNGVTYLGTFQDIEYTFKVSMKNIIYMIHILKIPTEVVGFYIYLLALSSYYGGGAIKRSRIAMADELGVTEKTITRYKKILKSHDIILEYYNNPVETKKINIIIVRGGDLYANSTTSN